MLYEHVFAYNQVMKLWLLQPRSAVLERSAHPWEPPFEKVMGLVVRAEHEAAARALAQEKAGNEGLGIYRTLGIPDEPTAANVWLDAAWTQCDELGAEGEAGVILVDRYES